MKHRGKRILAGCLAVFGCVSFHVTTVLAASDLRLNPDALERLKGQGYVIGGEWEMPANELFLGMDSNFTLNDISGKLGKYNLPVMSWSGMDTEGVVMGNLYIAISGEKIVDIDHVMNQSLPADVVLSTAFLDPGYGEFGMGQYLNTAQWANGQDGTDVVIQRVKEINGGDSLGQQAVQSSTPWRSNSEGWWYQESDGSYPRNQWKQVNGLWYYFDESGYMATGWRMIDGKWYFLQEGNGDMATGWKMINGTWYYFHDDGSMAANERVGDYYLTGMGAMQ